MGEVAVVRMLAEGDPLEHSDKWGKPATPFGVKLNSAFSAGKTLEFWFCGVLKVAEQNFKKEKFTHFALIEGRLLFDFEENGLSL